MTRRSARLQERIKDVPVSAHNIISTTTTTKRQSRKHIKLTTESIKAASDNSEEREGISSNTEDFGLSGRFRKPRIRLGLLQKLMTEMPLEIIYEIFVCLEPLDLLRLSRCSRDLRNMLISPPSKHIWRAARRNVGELPAPPPDLNEFQFAKLVFDTNCQVCGYGYCDNLIWESRTRCCLKCTNKVFISRNELERKYSSDAAQLFYMGLGTQDLLIHIPRHRSHYLASEIDFRFSQLKNVLSKGESVHDWLKKVEKEWEERSEHAKSCRAWQTLQRQRREYEFHEIRQQRKQDIENRLATLGWADELERLDAPDSTFSTHAAFRPSVKLTDKEWDRIAPALVDVLQSERTRYLQELRVQTLRDRHLLLGELYRRYVEAHGLAEAGYPPLGDVVESGIFHDTIWNTPFKQVSFVSDWVETFAEKIPSFIKEWKTRKTDDLRRLVKKSAPEANVDNLELANPDCDPYELLGVSPWNKSAKAGQIVYSAYGSETIKKVLQVSGLSSEATLKEIIELDPLVECRTCQTDSGRLFMRWSKALHHIPYNQRQKLRNGETHEYVVFADDMHEVIGAEKLPTAMTNSWQAIFHCNQCWDRQKSSEEDAWWTREPGERLRMSFKDLETHMESKCVFSSRGARGLDKVSANRHGIATEKIEAGHWSWAQDIGLEQKAPEAIRL
ncbi:hypothetical protein VKT23_016751 [Stygiomarasmius scandens]|uniref:F-box domain-containing protein n=1 Tax=Marasmiellus scandens TaxID=2682957 RepID=A0ABR1IWB3_9AGAR